jgi:large subunit ribosomal protein L17
MTAATLERVRKNKQQVNEMTQRNIEKVTRFRPDGKEALKDMINRLRTFSVATQREKEAEAKEIDDEELPGNFESRERRGKRGKSSRYSQV